MLICIANEKFMADLQHRNKMAKNPKKADLNLKKI